MSNTTGYTNSCDITTIFPMGVVCSTEDATSPTANNGSMTVFVSGGTPPYTIQWSNGMSGVFTLNNLPPGTYFATVTDYYGDYTVTTECVVDYDSFYLDKLLECAEISSPNIYVFYDGTSLNETKATEASNSIREWYSGKTDEGFGGLLYEGVVGETSHNGENWLWWATYPYLGSLTGGTLSDSTPVEIFGLNGESVTNSVSTDPRWCKNTSGPCIPKNVSFNFKNTTYQRINRGLNLSNGGPDSRSQGVPFNAPSSLDGDFSGIYGDFNGGDTNYIVICVIDEADGLVGLYHGQIDGTSSNPTKSDLYNDPFVLKGNGWNTSNSLAPSDRYIGDYEGFLQVWEDIVVNQNGSFNGLIYPVCDSQTARISFVQHSVATIEGETITSSEYTTKYGGSITNVGPENLNLSALTRTNVYTALTTNSIYTSLPAQYQQGSGLKNFGWQVDPDVTNFTSTVVGNTLDEFFENVQLSDNAIYIEQGNTFNPSLIYSFNEIDGCYQFDSTELWTGQTYSAVTVNSPYNDCIECQPVTPNPPAQPDLCLSYTTSQYTFTANGTDSNGNYTWVNSTYSLTMSYNTTIQRWEISNWNAIGGGIMGFNQNPPTIPLGSWTNYGVSNESVWQVTQGACSGLPLGLSAQATDETCQNSADGTVTVTINGGTAPFTLELNNLPPVVTSATTYTFTGLNGGNNTIIVSDSASQSSTQNITIGVGNTQTTYQVTFTSSVTTNGPQTQNSKNETLSWTLGVTPALPVGATLTFNLNVNQQNNQQTSTNYGANQVAIFGGSNSLSTSNVTINSSGVIGPNAYTSSGSICGVFSGDTTFDVTNMTITSQSSVSGIVNYSVSVPSPNNASCPIYGSVNVTVSVDSLSITGVPCAVVLQENQIINEQIIAGINQVS